MRRIDFAFFERHHVQTAPHHFEQLTRPQQEVRIAGLAEALVAEHEGFINQHPAFADGIDQQGQQRAMQVVGDDNAVELACMIGPGAILDVGQPGRHAGHCLQGSQRGCVAVQRLDPITKLRKVTGMAALAASQIENIATCCNLWRKTLYP